MHKGERIKRDLLLFMCSYLRKGTVDSFGSGVGGVNWGISIRLDLAPTESITDWRDGHFH